MLLLTYLLLFVRYEPTRMVVHECVSGMFNEKQ